MKYLFFIISLSSLILCNEQNDQSIEIVTKDGNIFLGVIVDENGEQYILKTKDGITISIPKSSVIKKSYLETKEFNGEVYRADPNKSMYFFAPSAFPIGQNQAYCRDFCLFFPSYNRGFGNTSIQAGAFVFPGMGVVDIPLVLSAKYSLQNNILNLATGFMYVKMPVDGENSFGTGLLFLTNTLGNNFNHFSTSLGWGYIKTDSDWEFSENPLFNFASNFRVKDNLAFVGEFWKFPDVDLSLSPFMLAARFIGRQIAVDVGFITTLENDGIPFPLLNFTYHF